jgi:hypothetical protein
VNVVNRIGGLLLGIVLLAAGVVTIAETIALWAWHRSWPLPVMQWRRHLTATQWADRRVLVASVIVLVVGLLVLIAQLRRNRPAHLETALNTGDDVWVIRRHGVERQAADAVRTIRGVEAATATATGTEDHWQLSVAATAVGDVVDTEDVRQAVQAKLRNLGASEEVPVRVSVTRSRS